DLPLLKYEGKIKLIETQSEIQRAIDHCMEHDLVGFDTETKPTFKKGQYHAVALVQLAIKDVVYLIRLSKTGFEEHLVRLFEDSNTVKVGIGLRDDIRDLQKIKNFHPDGFLDLNEFAENFGMESIGARKLSGIFLNGRISKSQQVSNWENLKLTHAQMIYAATDAWICLHIYEKMLVWKQNHS
ncbi:MAG: 3'-5' exonuclease domain-containing protein 2, partial [Cyclobacteriaceae bacterium]|nr:3'-5' exonuclease domain-containing protein 2 [Cyclobacteriaceae bacterium]